MNSLRYYRELAGLTADELAAEIGVDRTQITKAEVGGYDLKGQNWKRAAEVLKCTVDELLMHG